jgi:hypothetical protein
VDKRRGWLEVGRMRSDLEGRSIDDVERGCGAAVAEGQDVVHFLESDPTLEASFFHNLFTSSCLPKKNQHIDSALLSQALLPHLEIDLD